MTKQSIDKSAVSPKQQGLLREVCRFRFVTAELLTAHLRLASVNALRRRLQRLMDTGYLARHYGSGNRLQRLPATYYVTPKSRLLLRHDVPEAVLNGIYKHEHASKRLQDHCVTVLKVMVQLEQRLGTAVTCYPKNDLAIYDYLPSPLPDGLIITTDAGGRRHDYLLEVFDSSTPRFVIRNRLRYYRDYFEAGGWNVTNLPVPTIQVVCRSTSQQEYTQTVLDSLILGDTPSIRFELTVVT
ncbi:MAG: replication-relaxation family protein [Candidatus Saccharimonadales bacterium]